MTNIGERITLARKQKLFSQAQLSEVLGVSRGACGQWEQGHAYPNVQHLIEIAKVLDIQLEWLATGRGEMAYSSEIKEAPGHYQASMPADEQLLISYYRKMNKQQQQALIKLAKTMPQC